MEVYANENMHSNKGKFLKNIKKSGQLYVFVLLAFLTILVFNYIPMYGVLMAFQNFNPVQGIWGSEWVGFEHFRVFFSSPFFWDLLRNTLMLSIYSLIAGFPLPIILALAFNEVKDGFFKKFTQTVTYAPHFISIVVMTGMVISFLSPSTGIINHMLGWVGIEPINFLSSSRWFRSLYVWSGIWQSTGWGTVIYLAALSGVDPTLHEAAIMDGATRLKRIWYINIPTIMPTIIILLIMNVGAIMTNGFERVLLLQTPLNLETSRVISTYVFEVGLEARRFSFATAVGLFNSVVNAVLLITVNIISKKVSDIGLW